MSAIAVPEDRSLRVPPGKVVRTAYVPIDVIRLACRDRMSPGDIAAAYQRRLAIAPSQPWPPPVGEWERSRFAIHDGRHDYVAALMLGFESILVAWIADA